MRDNLREMAIAQETTPGSAETVVEADCLVRPRDGDTLTVDVDSFDPEEVQASSSNRPMIKTVKRWAADMSYLLRGPDSQSTDPAAKLLLESAMLRAAECTKIAIGAITGGPYVHNEILTGGTSGATARVMIGVENGASAVRVIDIVGTFQTEVLTGSVSGATCTSTDTGTASGMAFVPCDSDFGVSDTKHHVTAHALIDGMFFQARGALSNLVMDFEVGHPVIARHALSGAYDNHGDVALFGKTAYAEEDNTVPKWLNSQLTFGSYTPRALVNMTLDLGVETRLLADANDTSNDGVEYADYSRNGPTLSLEPKLVKVVSYDFFQTLIDGTVFPVRWRVGQADGMVWEFYAPEAQYSEVGLGSRDGTVTAPVTLRLNGSDNSELVILQR